MTYHYYENMESDFKTNLRNELDYQGLTVKELSEKTGIPKPTLSCYLSSRQTMPTADAAVKIAKALNVSVEFLVTGKDSKIIPRGFEKNLSYSSIIKDFAKLSPANKHSLEIMIHALADSESK